MALTDTSKSHARARSSTVRGVIVTATHKPFDVPAGNHYLPVHVGASGRDGLGYARDDSGDNISHKNSMYCELTGLYWVWKNVEAEYIGLAHYRRQLSSKRRLFRPLGQRKKCVITEDQLASMVQPGLVLVPHKRRYWVSTIRDQYTNTMMDGAIHLAATREAIESLAPDYLGAFDKQMRRRSAHLFNMFVMPSDLLDEYCAWLFPILERIEETVDHSDYSSFDKRFVGRVAERLLDVWIDHNAVPVKHIGRVDLWRVNYIAKAFGYARASLLGRKQESSS